jgi:hypothetical protein
MNGEGFFTQRVLRGVLRHLNNFWIARTAWRVAQEAPRAQGRPVVLFKASTGIDDLSWNSGFHLLCSWALRLKGVPVVYFACRQGMSHCVLGTNRGDVHKPPPCKSCIHQSKVLYTGVPALDAPRKGTAGTASRVRWFTYDRDAALEAALEGLSLDELTHFKWPTAAGGGRQSQAPAAPIRSSDDPEQHGGALTLGALCLPSLRWILRRHNLDDDEPTRYLLREYILSAWNVACQVRLLLADVDPCAVVVFNGQYFPEAVVRRVALQRGLRVITHEVGLQPASAFFTDGEATAYPIAVPHDFQLSPTEEARLDAYLEQRFEGNFTMAGVQFWPRMQRLGPEFLKKASGFSQIVPIFANVIFDTSQAHANAVFPDMFAWLDATLEVIRGHPETLFVIRAHPDESRLRKESRETVRHWAQETGAVGLENVIFVPPTEYLSSYELIQRAKFVMVYNSTIGLEASIMGRPVLSGGKARYTQLPTVFFPKTVQEQRRTMEAFLAADAIDVPPEFGRNSRRFLYFQLFRTSLPFADFLVPSVRKTQTRLRQFEPEHLLSSASVRAILEGLLENGDFCLPR